MTSTCLCLCRSIELEYQVKASLEDNTYGDEDYVLGGKVAYKGAGRANALRAAAFRRGRGSNNRVAMRGGSRARGRGKRSSNGEDSSGGESAGAYERGMDTLSNGNGGRGSSRRRSNQRTLSGSALMPARGGRGGSRSRGGGRARGRIGRGLSQAAEALLGMGGEYDQDEAMTVRFLLPDHRAFSCCMAYVGSCKSSVWSGL